MRVIVANDRNMMVHVKRAILIVACLSHGLMASAVAPKSLDVEFQETIGPFLGRYCIACHGKDKPKAKLSLSEWVSRRAVASDAQRLELVLEKLEARSMPPKNARPQPNVAQRRAVVDWIRRLRRDEADRNAGDPGPVLARRLSNSEYDYTIRDLTGVDIRPTREFPLDPANEAGFDNSGESLAMTPALLNKYLAAARRVADHLVLTHNSVTFAPHPVVADTDRDKFCIQRIVDFYRRQPTDYSSYLKAAWTYHHRQRLGQPEVTVEAVAGKAEISAGYLSEFLRLLTGPDISEKPATGPTGELRKRWRALPSPKSKEEPAPEKACAALADWIAKERQKWQVPEFAIVASVIQRGSQPMVLLKNRTMASNRRKGKLPANPDNDREIAALRQSVKEFCSVIPDAFYVSERGRVFLAKKDRNKGRLLSAGFHLMTGYFRDDSPLYELILDAKGRAELDRLWSELDFITLAPIRQFRDYVFFERAESPRFMESKEFDFARSEDKDLTSPKKMKRLTDLYISVAKTRKATPVEMREIRRHFSTMSKNIRRVESERRAAEQKHLAALLGLASRAYRRPLKSLEREGLLAFYRELRTRHELAHEPAMRDLLVAILVSPHFSYRVVRSEPGRTTHRLDGFELASRLSYFLWSSLPDQELSRLAAAKQLSRPEVLRTQVKRMLRDPRAEALGTEFLGQWLGVRQFEKFNGVDRKRFPAFTPALRKSMYQEPLRYFDDVVKRNGSLVSLIAGRHAIVNRVLADHYGLPVPDGIGDGAWFRVERADRQGRGGLLPMGVFLTSNSSGLRTSPVRRGYWVVHRLLGEHIPPPPPKVPDLPSDEADLGDVTLRELLVRHRKVAACAGCHARFDSFGLVFEGYGPVGERRTKDGGGRSVDNRAEFPGGGRGAGLEGLRQHLVEKRREQFVENVVRRLFAYALGRRLMLSDRRRVEAMKSMLVKDGYRIRGLVEQIVLSRQFLEKRDREFRVSR